MEKRRQHCLDIILGRKIRELEILLRRKIREFILLWRVLQYLEIRFKREIVGNFETMAFYFREKETNRERL